MKPKPKGPKRASRVKTKAGRQLGKNPSEREVKDFIVGAIETSLAENLEQMGFSKREVKDLHPLRVGRAILQAPIVESAGIIKDPQPMYETGPVRGAPTCGMIPGCGHSSGTIEEINLIEPRV
ncbi:MAG TPA: hypothetical protein VKM54_26365 [Myxococcota bacterium]|nr:hypothetical protein [Myxococcota bacterium]